MTTTLWELGTRGELVTDSQDVRELLERVGMPMEYRADITGVVVADIFGVIWDAWFTESASPWDVDAVYHSTEYYGVEVEP